MRYWKPFVDEAIERMTRDGIRRVVALPLYPQYSGATTGSSLNALEEAVRASGTEIDFRIVRSWETHAPYIDALAETVREGIEAVTASGGEQPALLFSAHSLPVRFIEEGDPYLDQVRATVSAVVDRLGWDGSWRLAFQSRTGPVRWLTPSTPDALEAIASEGHHRVVVVPVSFVSDHIETLEELDVQYGEVAATLGITDYVRTAGLNVRPRFIAALASLVTEQLGSRVAEHA
jgi:ferrochelatase